MPQTIYNRPTNLFVAGFIGSPAMNFIRGTTINGGKSFRVGDRTTECTLSLAGYDGNTSMERPDAVLGLRPEHLIIQSLEEPGQTIPAEVELDEPMGADSLVWLKAVGQQMSVRIPVEKRPVPGTKVFLKVDIAKASIFDAASELRI